MRLFPGISVLTLGVGNVERASLFYERLGWRRAVLGATPAESIFALNNLLLRLAPSDALAADVGAAEPHVYTVLGQNYGDAGAVGRTLQIADLAGARILRGVSPRGAGANAAFSDPDGHIWSLTYDPDMIPAADGAVRPLD